MHNLIGCQCPSYRVANKNLLFFVMILNTRECNVPFTWYSDHLKKQEVVAVEDGVSIEDMDIFHKHLMLYERRQGLPSVQVLDLPLSNFHKTVCLLTSLET